MNILHSAATPRWGTPADVVERARRVMGRITLDVCSEARFQEVVQADDYYSLDRGRDALQLPWEGRVFVNPPGRQVRKFWDRLITQAPEQAIWVGFSLEQLALLADAAEHPSDHAICFLRKRVRFTRHDGYSGSPSHSNYLVGYNVDHDAFLDEFGPLGKVQFGPLA